MYAIRKRLSAMNARIPNSWPDKVSEYLSTTVCLFNMNIKYDFLILTCRKGDAIESDGWMKHFLRSLWDDMFLTICTSHPPTMLKYFRYQMLYQLLCSCAIGSYDT